MSRESRRQLRRQVRSGQVRVSCRRNAFTVLAVPVLALALLVLLVRKAVRR